VVGWYKLDADGNPTDPQIIWQNASEPGEGEISPGDDGDARRAGARQSFGFFIIQDGAEKYSWLNGQLNSKQYTGIRRGWRTALRQ
jgi:hypothetical protein